MTLALFLSVLLGSILLGLPVAFALLLAAMALMLHMDLFSADILAQALINGVDSFPLLAIPFFWWRVKSCRGAAFLAASSAWRWQ